MNLLCFGQPGFLLSIFVFFCVLPCQNDSENTGLKPTHKQKTTCMSSPKKVKAMNYINIYFSAFYSSRLIILLLLTILLFLCGDIHPNPGPTNTNAKLSIVHNNICSLANKTIFIEAELGHFDIITLSETKLHSKSIEDKLIINGYTPPVRCDRTGDTGHGGVAIYVKKDLICIHRPDLEVPGLEAVWVETRLNQDILLVGSFYRAPDERVAYWDLIEESINKAGNTPHKYIVLGDFNCDNDASRPHINRIIYLNNLNQLITEPTRVTENTSTLIDLILTPCPEIVQKVGVLPAVQSDHRCPFIEIKSESMRNSSFKRTIYNYNKLDNEKFNNMLDQADWNEIVSLESLNEAAETFTNKLMTLAKTCMPSKTITIRENDAPWMTEEIRKLIERKLRVHLIAKILDSNWCWELFRKIRNNLTDLIRKRKENYCQEMEDKINSGNGFGNKDWWKLVNRFSQRKGTSQSNIPPIQHGLETIYSNSKKAEIFNEYFISQSKLNDHNNTLPDINENESIIPQLVITTSMVRTIIESLDLSKAVGPDGVHNKILKAAANKISEPLCTLFNRSLDENIFPETWKIANVTPIYKKGDKYVCKNYRPISLLSCIGKLLERCVHGHVYNHLKENNLLTVSQSGFIKKDSTSYQLLAMYTDFCQAIDNRITTQSVFFDISKAFDRVWHAGLLRKLYAIGIRGTLHEWFRSYLSNRFQAVVIKGERSSYKKIPAGVPQGSVLGPLLFLIYINDIVNGIQSSIKLFADDTSIYLSIDDVERRTHILNSDMLRINEWAKSWKVDFNPGKTELMTITTKRQPETLPLSFGNVALVEKPEHKHLGVIIQNNCKWDSHINFIISKAKLQVACLRSYKYKLSRKCLEIMYNSFILPHFDYCDTVWDNCTLTLCAELEKLNLDAIRTVIGAVRGTSHLKLYQESGILPLKERRQRHKLILFFKIIKGLTPSYLSTYLPPLVAEFNPHHRRNPLQRYIPRCRTEIYAQSFFPSTTTAWNALPDNIKSSDSLAEFKRHLRSNDANVPLYYYSENRIAEIIHCKIRLEISDLNSDLFKRHLRENKYCSCGHPDENALHFFYNCPLFDHARRNTINTIHNLQLLRPYNLTHGDQRLSFEQNKHIFEKVQEFIINSKRFS